MWARTIRYGRAIRYPGRNAHTRKRDPKFGDDLEIGLNKPVERTAWTCFYCGSAFSDFEDCSGARTESQIGFGKERQQPGITPQAMRDNAHCLRLRSMFHMLTQSSLTVSSRLAICFCRKACKHIHRCIYIHSFDSLFAKPNQFSTPWTSQTGIFAVEPTRERQDRCKTLASTFFFFWRPPTKQFPLLRGCRFQAAHVFT